MASASLTGSIYRAPFIWKQFEVETTQMGHSKLRSIAVTMQEAILRKYGNSEGEVQIMQPVRLSDFIQVSTARHPLRAV